MIWIIIQFNNNNNNSIWTSKLLKYLKCVIEACSFKKNIPKWSVTWSWINFVTARSDSDNPLGVPKWKPELFRYPSFSAEISHFPVFYI